MSEALKSLRRSVEKAPVAHVRRCLTRIVEEYYLDRDGKVTVDKELGSDFIEAVGGHLGAYGFCPVPDEWEELDKAIKARRQRRDRW